jgi:hypothetical protein
MQNNLRMAVDFIAGNTNTLETALAAAVHYKSALNIGGQIQGGAHRYGQVAALQVTGDENAAAQASSSNGSAAGMHEMKVELTVITSALASIGVQKKGGKGKPPGGAPPRGPRKQPSGSMAGGTGAERSTADALGPQHARDWIKSTIAADGGSTLRQSAQGRKQSATSSQRAQSCRHPGRRGTLCLTQTKQPVSCKHDSHWQGSHQQERTISARKGEKV